MPVSFAVVLMVLLWTPPSHAHSFIYNLEDGTPVFRASIPDGWRLDLDFDPPLEGVDAPPPPRVVEAIPKDGARLWLGMWVITEIEDVGGARDYFESLKEYLFSDVRQEDSRMDDFNGMPARYFSGTARKGREPVEWAILLFKPAPGAVAAVLYIGVPDARREHGEALKTIVDSITPLSD